MHIPNSRTEMTHTYILVRTVLVTIPYEGSMYVGHACTVCCMYQQEEAESRKQKGVDGK